MNFSRKLILVAGAALLAACGDKVTVAAPTPPVTPVLKINSVEVAPSTATITAGQSITFTAAVNADAGVTYTTAWTSSVSSVTVNATTGVVTTTSTSVTPGAAICATATAGTQVVKGCATLVVTAQAAVLPASISIASITSVGGLNAPVNPANVSGQIDIKLNVNPGNQTVTKVVLLVGGIRVDSQLFSAAQAAAFRFTADQAVAAQTTFPTIIFSVNTAQFNALTGAPKYMNGTQSVSAQLYTVQGGTVAAATASVATSLTFNNVNTVTGTVTTVGGNSAIDASGYGWKSGAISASIIPVIYTAGTTIGTVTMRFGDGTCDNSLAGPRNMQATAPVSGSYAYTATFNNTDAASAANNVVSYEFGPVACPLDYAAGGQLATADVFDGSGNGLALVQSLGRVRLDNLAPTVPVLKTDITGTMLEPGTRTGGWVNDAVLFTKTVAASAANGIIAGVAVDGGVNSVTYVAKVGTTVYTTPAGIAEAVAANEHQLDVYATDKLGNQADAVSATFSVDRTAPAITMGSNPANNGGFGIAAANNITTLGYTTYAGTSVTDASTAGSLPSGFQNLGGTPITVIQSRRNATNTRYFCPTTAIFQKATDACAAWTVDATDYASNLNVDTNFGTAGDAYVTTVASVSDQAGNVSPLVTRVYANDITAPAVSMSVPALLPADGSTLTVTGSMADALHLRGQQLDVLYTGFTVLPAAVVYAAGATDRFFANTPLAMDAYNPTALSTTGSFSQTIPHFVAQLQSSDGATPSNFSAQTAVTSVDGAALDVGSNATITAAGVLAPAATAFTTLTFKWGTPAFQTTGGSATSNISRDGGCGATSLLYGTTRVVTIDAVGPSGPTFPNPFTRVQFWAYQDGVSAANTGGIPAGAGSLNPSLISGNLTAARAGWRLLGEVTQATMLDDSVIRTWRFNLTFDPTADQLPWYGNSSCGTADYMKIVAVGLNGGAGVVSPATAQLNVWR